MQRKRAWWGEWEFSVGDSRRWQIGAATIAITRRLDEWILLHEASADPFSEAFSVAEISESEIPSNGKATLLRFAGGQSDRARVRLAPRLANRNVISRPESSFAVLPQSSTTVFVGSSAWFSLQAAPGYQQVAEFPLLRASDTWFGPNTREGELCYASRTRCRTRFEDVRWNPHRAVTRVTIRNPAATPLPIDRINLPAPTLALWALAGGMLLTSPVTYTREGSDENVAQLEVGAPPESSAILVADPRQTNTKNRLVRAFSRLL